MRDDMYEGKWSPFDPQWYEAAFDKFISTADELFNQDLIIGQGWRVPDVDGSRSSVFRTDAVLNNSFNEQILRDTLRDIYTNSSHKLIAANHDNVHFYQWHGYMSDMTFTANSNYCEFRIPVDTFLDPSERDIYKLSQFSRKWIKVEDILNNWRVFKWACLIFVNQKIISEYEFHIDDHEVAVRFPFYEYWKDQNFPVYIYKFDTYAQARVLISRELCENQWNWKMPVNYIKNPRISSNDKVIVAINKVLNHDIRDDGVERIEFIGDNLEFLEIKDGYIDLSGISQHNRIEIQSETTEWLWMSIVIPKFFHEYPILLPTDVVYQPYVADLRPVVTKQLDSVKHAKADNNKNKQRQLYVDMNGKLREPHNGWKQMVRPIVLADAFDNPNGEDYTELITEIDTIRDCTVISANFVEDLRECLLNYTTDKRFDDLIDNIQKSLTDVRETMHAFMDKRLMEYDDAYERRYEKCMKVIDDIREDGAYSEYLTAPQGDQKDFFEIVSPCIHISREFVDKYYVIKIINSMTPEEKVLWEDVENFMGKIRFQRPIEVSDFWTFEYDIDDRVWRPFPLKMEHRFPDVYIPTIPNINGEPTNRIFKSFFFYSDNVNILDTGREIDHATPDWSDDSTEYYFEQAGTYRDIFMEKFYWMGVRAIYRGLLMTQNRWETLEHVIGNPSYDRFNELFMKTMDPYFKLGLATYLKSNNYNFPFDDAIDKLKEAMEIDFLGYKRVTNFEAYLNRSWIPSYFDYVTKIMDGWDYTHRLLRRPRNTFDIGRLLPILIKTQNEVFVTVRDINQDVAWILERLAEEDYNLNIDGVRKLKEIADEMERNMSHVLDFTKDLDLEIYSIADINHIIECLRKHFKMTAELNEQLKLVLSDTNAKLVYDRKSSDQTEITHILDAIPTNINDISALVQGFDMDSFMYATNDLRSYITYDKNNPDDNSLIGQINQFDDDWTMKVKEQRNKLFTSTTVLFGLFDPNKSYSEKEVVEFINKVAEVRQDIKDMSYVIREYWVGYTKHDDRNILDRLDFASDYLTKLEDNLNEYMCRRAKLVENLNAIYGLIDDIMSVTNISTEPRFDQDLRKGLAGVLHAMSYIVGQNKKFDAVEALQEAKNVHVDWVQAVNLEQQVFEKILKMAEIPSGYIAVLLLNQEMLEASIGYMDMVNIPYHPDERWPSYSDVYEVEEVQLVNGGFLHKPGDIIFVPKLGSYKIDAVTENVASARHISDMGYRTTSFRDPRWQFNDYDSITDGEGMGVRVKPTAIKHTKIINDEVVFPIFVRVQNAMYLVSRCCETPNPYNNTELSHVIDSISVIKSDWEDIVKVYKDHMTPEMFTYTTELIDLLMQLINPSKSFVNTRASIGFSELMDSFEKYIVSVYNYTEQLGTQDNKFYYFDNQIRKTYFELEDFYGNGTSWSDGKRLKQLIETARSPISFYKTNIVDHLPDGEERAKIIEIHGQLMMGIVNLTNNINLLPTIQWDINAIVNKLQAKIKDAPNEYHKDIWYKLKHVVVAVEGSNYKVGDIVELVPELPLDSEGHPMTALEEVVMNDVILMQITKVEFGHVMQVQPMMEYALPYRIWGLRDTNTRVGSGFGLRLDIYSYELQLSDSNIFDDVKSDVSKLPPFDENDMFMFKFDNIHDLDIGYEVFLGGKQITNFVQRHETVENPLHPKNMDVLYLNANEVMNLQNVSIYIPAEHYFVYRIDKVEVKDPGAGYTVGQDIFVDTDQIALRLKVASLVYGPTKGIAEIGYGDINLNYKVDDPKSDFAIAATDSLNNIDDEFNTGYYDQLTAEGITKPATKEYGEDFLFQSHRFDDLQDGDRNAVFMQPDGANMHPDGEADNGDPDYHYYLGSGIEDQEIWKRMYSTIPPTHPFIPDALKTPPGKPVNVEYQMFKRVRIHNSIGETNTDVTHKFSDGSVINSAMVKGDLTVPDFAHLPKWDADFPEGRPGSKIIVECDETHEGHRMLYTIRTYVAYGYFVYDLPEIADYRWDHITVDWMNIDSYPDMPTDKANYPTAPWGTAASRRKVQHEISDKKHDEKFPIQRKNHTAFISNMTVEDLSVFNWSTMRWEDLSDKSRWKLTVVEDDENQKWGFTLAFLEEGTYSYDMSFFLNKTPDNQMKNAMLKRNAVVSVATSIADEVNRPAINTSIYTGRHVRIRKLFPYEQKETFTIGKSEDGDPLGYEMNFKLAPYIHFKNEIHLEDIKIYNKTAGRFENILDRQLFEVRFKDPKAVSRGYEIQTEIMQTFISSTGEGFVDGEVWAWNPEFQTHVFGHVTTDGSGVGGIRTFVVDHFNNPPTEDVTLEFQVFQHVNQSTVQMAVVVIEFQTRRVEVFGDGYIHNVSNRMAPVPEEFKVIVQYNLDEPTEYDIIISKRARKWRFMEPMWVLTPTFALGGCNIQQDHLYILTSAGRFPLVNPSTGKPSLQVTEGEQGTVVKFMNMYKRYERLEVRSVPYPMRSVYVQRRIPKSGYINLDGKINKPLNRKYFEFWVNGKLLMDEVTIITPTKLFLHGLTSLKNFEIIEVNRDPNEYFSEAFLGVDHSKLDRPFRKWDFRTYLDDALDGKLKGDNYTLEEQEYLLTPVWKQVEKDHPEYKNYPPNVDIDPDILVRTAEGDNPLEDISEPNFQYMVVDTPTIEGYPLMDRAITFKHFGFIPIDANMLIDLMNEEWAEEIEKDPYFPSHSIMTDDEWYGMVTRLYDEFGIRVHTLDEAAYKIVDSNLLRINTENKINRIVHKPVTFDLS